MAAKKSTKKSMKQATKAATKGINKSFNAGGAARNGGNRPSRGSSQRGGRKGR